MKNLILLFFCSTFAGCAAVPAKPSLPAYSFKPDWTLAQRQSVEERAKILELRGKSAVVGAAVLERDSLIQLYLSIDARDAATQAEASQKDSQLIEILPEATLAAGSAAGFLIGGGFYLLSQNNLTTTNDGWALTVVSSPRRGVDIRMGALAGLGIGSLLALIEYPILMGASQRHFEKSAFLYNKHLRSSLQLDVVAQPGGAKAGVDMRF